MKTNVTLLQSGNHLRRTQTMKVIATVGLAILSVTAFLGNFLIVVLFYKNKKIQTVTNFYLVSLALTDMIVGFYPVNMYLTEIVLEVWPFGKIYCDFVLLTDSLLSQVSIYHVIMISADRYLSIRQPLKYRVSQTKSRVRYYLLGIWLVAFLLWTPIILYRRYISTKNNQVSGNLCFGSLHQVSFDSTIGDIEFYFFLTSVILGFFVPMALAVFINVKMYLLIKQQHRTIPKFCKTSLRISFNTVVTEVINSEKKSIEQKKDEETFFKKKQLAKHNKAMRMIGTIIFTFLITLFPYYLQMILGPFCSKCYNDISLDISSILTYSYSAVNPFLYAFGSQSFRKQCQATLSIFSTKDFMKNISSRNKIC